MEEQERMAEMLPETIPEPVSVPEQAVQWYQNVTLEDAEAFIGANLKSAARSVIAIGYYLKCIRDGRMYEECGYENIWDYAREKFGFSMSTASRYMTRNDKFSKGGNSPILDKKYREYNKSQLQEMLSLDTDQLEQVTPTMTVKEIRQMRKPAEIPYVEIPGQMNVSDFLDGKPAQETEVLPAVAVEIPMQTGNTTLQASDFVEPEEPEVIATSQQEPVEFQEVDETATCPPDISFCPRQQWGIAPKEQAEGKAECKKCWSNWKNTQKALGAAKEQQDDEEVAAETQQKLLSAYGTPKTVYPEGSLLTTKGCEGGHSCFLCSMDCQIRQDFRQCRESTCGDPFPCEQVTRLNTLSLISAADKCQFLNHSLADHFARNDAPDPCCKNCDTPCEFVCSRAKRKTDGQYTFESQDERIAWFIKKWSEFCPSDFKSAMRAMRLSKNPAELAKDIQNAIAPCGHHGISCSKYKFLFRSLVGGMEWEVGGEKLHLKYGRLAKELVQMYDPWSKEYDELADAAEPEEPMAEEPDVEDDQLTDLQLAKEQLEREQRLLNRGLDAVPDEGDIHIRRMKIRVAALANFVCELDDIENTPPKPEQPELPILKNNDQRAAFVDAYETWPLWIEQKETGERYYRYDLPDGTSMVVKVYHAMIFAHDINAVRWEENYREGYGRNEYYLLRPGKFFRDCDANRSMLIEKLKNIQKGGVKNEQS